MSKINVVIPMAGLGSRFSQAGYAKPKPFIDVAGLPMIERVIQNMACDGARYILIGRKEHFQSEAATVTTLQKKYGCEFIGIDRVTEGAACTILHAAWHINNDTPLLLANSDQIVDLGMNDFVGDAQSRKLDGSILCFDADHPKWSYVKLNEAGLVTELREKQVISRHATVGIYYFTRGRDFVSAAAEMIGHNDRTNNEFYTAPAYNYQIKQGQGVGIYTISPQQMHGTGTPEDLDAYLKLITTATR